MPKDTPSPHRFLAPRASAIRPTKQKPSSRLRNLLAPPTPQSSAAPSTQNAQARRTAPENAQARKTASAKRFVLPPARKNVLDARHDIHSPAVPRPVPRRKLERVESIHDSPHISPESAPEERYETSVVHSVEGEPMCSDDLGVSHHDNDEDEGQDKQMRFDPRTHHKRRRISPPTSPSRTTRPTPLPQTPPIPPPYRFKLPPPRTPAHFHFTTESPTTAQPSTPSTKTNTPVPISIPPPNHRPHFLLPAPRSPAPHPPAPLPELFSPSRKKAKHIPNGLAATMTSWIIQVANTGLAAQHRSTNARGSNGAALPQAQPRDHSLALRLQAHSVSNGSGNHNAFPTDDIDPGAHSDAGAEVQCRAGGVVFVTGVRIEWDEPAPNTKPNRTPTPSTATPSPLLHTQPHPQSRLLLAGNGGARGGSPPTIRKGAIIDVRAPMWDLVVQGEAWSVGVEWLAASHVPSTSWPASPLASMQ